MIAAGDILAELRRRYDSGSTQQELSQLTGVSRSYIRDLLSGKRAIDGLTIKKINQLFPRSVLQLNGDTVSIHANRNSGNVVGVNHGTISQDCLSAVENRILESTDLTAEEKIKVLKVLKK